MLMQHRLDDSTSLNNFVGTPYYAAPEVSSSLCTACGRFCVVSGTSTKFSCKKAASTIFINYVRSKHHADQVWTSGAHTLLSAASLIVGIGGFVVCGVHHVRVADWQSAVSSSKDYGG